MGNWKSHTCEIISYSWREKQLEAHRQIRGETREEVFFFFLLKLHDNTKLHTPNCSGLSRNTVGYQQRRSAVCERVTERLEIVSGGASLHLISAVRRGPPTLEINWMIYFGVTPAALSPCFFASCATLCNVAGAVADVLLELRESDVQ